MPLRPRTSAYLVDAYNRHTLLHFDYRNSCNIVFSLVDSYGDGWQGNHLNVSYSDGTPSEQMEVSNGSSATYIRELASGSTITLTWTNGQWTSECSFTIAYEDGTVIFQNSGGFSGSRTFTINCSGGGAIPEFCDPVRNLAYELNGHDVILVWDAPENGSPAWYEVYRESELLDLVEALTFTDPDRADGEYHYCVYAAYDGCQSEFVCTEVELVSCGAVKNLAYTLDEELVLTLTWEAPEDPTGLLEYQVYRDGEMIGSTNELTYAFMMDAGTYDVAVKAVFDGCDKDAHVQVCVVGAVENLHYVVAGNETDVAWDALEGVSQYEVYINDELVAMVDETHYAVELEAGLTTIMVKAVAEGCYVLGSSVEVCICDPITYDEGLTLDVNNNLVFSWNPVSYAEYYELNANGNVTTTTNTSYFEFPAVLGENTLCVTVHSIYGCNSETICLSQNVCDGVDGFDYSYNGLEVTFTWNDVGASFYHVDLVPSIGFETPNTNSFTTTLEEDGNYSFIINPFFEDCPAFTQRFDFTVINEAPKILITDVHQGLMATEWNEVEGVIGYNLYRDGELIAENLTTTAYNDTEMASDMRHCYAVQSVFEKGVSDISEEACANYFTGIGENDGMVSIFPNPTSDKVTIVCEGMTRIEVFTVEGKLVRDIEVENPEYQLDGLDSGIYTLRISKGAEMLVRRVIKH